MTDAERLLAERVESLLNYLPVDDADVLRVHVRGVTERAYANGHRAGRQRDWLELVGAIGVVAVFIVVLLAAAISGAQDDELRACRDQVEAAKVDCFDLLNVECAGGVP